MISILKKIPVEKIFAAVIILLLLISAIFSNQKYVYALTYKKTALINNTFSQNNRQDVVKLWAQALGLRNGSFRYAVLSNDLKLKEYQKYKDMNWVIGASSPWVVSFNQIEKAKINIYKYEYTINYIMSDSTRAIYMSHENLTVEKSGDLWFVVKHDDYEGIPDITQNQNKKFSKVQQSLSENPLNTDKSLNAADLWAQTLKTKNGSLRYALLSDELKAKEYAEYAKSNWSIGSPKQKIVDYKIKQTGRPNSNTVTYRIDYILIDSSNKTYKNSENIKLQNTSNTWYITSHYNCKVSYK